MTSLDQQVEGHDVALAPVAAVRTAVTVLVPTFNEAANVGELVARLREVLPGDGTHEVLFVDDSTDDTPQRIRDAAAGPGAPVRLLHRDEGTGGLGGAVVEGLRAASGEWVVVMDGDLQHPPTVVPGLVAAGTEAGADLVVATRYAGGGDSCGLANRYRRLVSQSSTTLTRALFPRRLAAVSDPMSGFFAVRRRALRLDDLRPLGFKIMLELVVRNGIDRIVEVPFTFGERFAGESKSSLREGARFVRHLCALRFGGSASVRILGFGLVGLSGFIPNLAVLWLLNTGYGMHYLPAAVISTQVAILWNFVLLELLVFTHHRRWRVGGRLLSFLALNNVDLIARLPLLALLVERGGMAVVPATAATLLVAFVLRFLITDRLIYLRSR
ncbi:glycosyltransferase [Pseudonocardia sp.]|uniref:glycosyltransferase n=1 Tax=Pseudonocardia sp. TaxID=60912 RepID=UPI003D0EB4CF